MVETTSTDPVTGIEYTTAEFEALRGMLDSEGIEWHDNSDEVFHRTQGEHKGRRFSAIFGYGSYGHERGYLEVRMDEDEPVGWLTATDALEWIAGVIDGWGAEQRAFENLRESLAGNESNRAPERLTDTVEVI